MRTDFWTTLCFLCSRVVIPNNNNIREKNQNKDCSIILCFLRFSVSGISKYFNWIFISCPRVFRCRPNITQRSGDGGNDKNNNISARKSVRNDNIVIDKANICAKTATNNTRREREKKPENCNAFEIISRGISFVDRSKKKNIIIAVRLKCSR